MTLSAACNILGLSPDEDPRPHLAEFRSARDRIAEMVRSATDETTANRYREGLSEFDQALAAIVESLAENQALPQPLPSSPAVKPLMRVAPVSRAVLMAGGTANTVDLGDAGS